MEIMILPCAEEQVLDCVRISVASYEKIHDVYEALLGEEIHDGVMGAWRQNKAKTIDQQQRGKNAMVALLDGKVAGFVSYSIINGVGHISNNAVDASFRGQGIAGRLYTCALEAMKKEGVQYASVLTGLDNGHAAARRAYKKVGFEKNLPYTTFYQKLEKTGEKPNDFADFGFEIKPFEKKDLSACEGIALNAGNQIHDAYIRHLGQEMHDAVMPKWEQELVREVGEQLENHKGFVLFDGENVIGFISYQIQDHLGIFGHHAIRTAYRGRGLGERLYRIALSRMEEDGAKFARVVVGMDGGQDAARRVCEKTGFIQGLPSVRYYQKL